MHPDYAAVEVLGLVMGDTPSGRLHQALTETQLASRHLCLRRRPGGPGLHGVRRPARAGAGSAACAGTVLIDTLESISAKRPFTAGRTRPRPRIRWLNNWERAFTDPEVIGISLSETVAQGDWRLFFLTRDRVQGSLALADLQRVAVQTLLPSNRTLGSYVPTEQPQRAREAGAGGRQAVAMQ